MKNDVSDTPRITIARPSTRSMDRWQDSVAGHTSSSMAGWRELPFPESPLELSTTKGDEFPDDYPFGLFADGPAFTMSSFSALPFQHEAFSWPFSFQNDQDRDLSLTLRRASMSTTLPSDPQSFVTEGEDRGRHFPATSPSGPNGRSRSIPRCSQVVSAMPRRVVSAEDLTAPRSLHRMEAVCAAVPSSAALPASGSLSDGDGHAHFTQGFDIYQYVNVDHDQLSSPRGNPSHNYPSASPSFSVTNRGAHADEHFDSETSPSSWVGAIRSGPTSMGTFLTAGDCRPHSLSAYYGLMVPQPRFASRDSPEQQMVTLDLDPLIHPNPIPGGAGNKNLSPVIGTTTPQQQESTTQEAQCPPSVKPSRFRASVGTKAMVEACRKRRKERDGARLFVCEVPECNRNFTARHNLRYHIKSHKNIRDEICPDCGADFVTRETRRRHSRTCDGVKKRSRY